MLPVLIVAERVNQDAFFLLLWELQNSLVDPLLHSISKRPRRVSGMVPGMLILTVVFSF